MRRFPRCRRADRASLLGIHGAAPRRLRAQGEAQLKHRNENGRGPQNRDPRSRSLVDLFPAPAGFTTVEITTLVAHAKPRSWFPETPADVDAGPRTARTKSRWATSSCAFNIGVASAIDSLLVRKESLALPLIPHFGSLKALSRASLQQLRQFLPQRQPEAVVTGLSISP